MNSLFSLNRFANVQTDKSQVNLLIKFLTLNKCIIVGLVWSQIKRVNFELKQWKAEESKRH